MTWKVPKGAASRIVAVADARAKAKGVAGRLPSDIFKKAEKDSGAKWMTELLPAIESISLDLGPRSEPNAKPALIVSLNGNAERWDKSLPGLFRAADPSDKPVTPSDEIVGGIKVRSYAVQVGAWSAIHSARIGNRIAFATTRAAAVRAVRLEMKATDELAAVNGRFPPERFFAFHETKPYAIKPPFAPPPSLTDVFAQLPEIRFAAARDSDPNRVVARLDHRGWTATATKRSAEALASWMEEMSAERIPGVERLEGGIMK